MESLHPGLPPSAQSPHSPYNVVCHAYISADALLVFRASSSSTAASCEVVLLRGPTAGCVPARTTLDLPTPPKAPGAAAATASAHAGEESVMVRVVYIGIDGRAYEILVPCSVPTAGFGASSSYEIGHIDTDATGAGGRALQWPETAVGASLSNRLRGSSICFADGSSSSAAGSSSGSGSGTSSSTPSSFSLSSSSSSSLLAVAAHADGSVTALDFADPTRVKVVEIAAPPLSPASAAARASIADETAAAAEAEESNNDDEAVASSSSSSSSNGGSLLGNLVSGVFSLITGPTAAATAPAPRSRTGSLKASSSSSSTITLATRATSSYRPRGDAVIDAAIVEKLSSSNSSSSAASDSSSSSAGAFVFALHASGLLRIHEVTFSSSSTGTGHTTCTQELRTCDMADDVGAAVAPPARSFDRGVGKGSRIFALKDNSTGGASSASTSFCASTIVLLLHARPAAASSFFTPATLVLSFNPTDGTTAGPAAALIHGTVYGDAASLPQASSSPAWTRGYDATLVSAAVVPARHGGDGGPPLVYTLWSKSREGQDGDENDDVFANAVASSMDVVDASGSGSGSGNGGVGSRKVWPRAPVNSWVLQHILSPGALTSRSDAHLLFTRLVVPSASSSSSSSSSSATPLAFAVPPHAGASSSGSASKRLRSQPEMVGGSGGSSSSSSSGHPSSSTLPLLLHAEAGAVSHLARVTPAPPYRRVLDQLFALNGADIVLHALSSRLYHARCTDASSFWASDDAVAVVKSQLGVLAPGGGKREHDADVLANAVIWASSALLQLLPPTFALDVVSGLSDGRSGTAFPTLVDLVAAEARRLRPSSEEATSEQAGEMMATSVVTEKKRSLAAPLALLGGGGNGAAGTGSSVVAPSDTDMAARVSSRLVATLPSSRAAVGTSTLASIQEAHVAAASNVSATHSHVRRLVAAALLPPTAGDRDGFLAASQDPNKEDAKEYQLAITLALLSSFAELESLLNPSNGAGATSSSLFSSLGPIAGPASCVTRAVILHIRDAVRGRADVRARLHDMIMRDAMAATLPSDHAASAPAAVSQLTFARNMWLGISLLCEGEAEVEVSACYEALKAVKFLWLAAQRADIGEEASTSSSSSSASAASSAGAAAASGSIAALERVIYTSGASAVDHIRDAAREMEQCGSHQGKVEAGPPLLPLLLARLPHAQAQAQLLGPRAAGSSSTSYAPSSDDPALRLRTGATPAGDGRFDSRDALERGAGPAQVARYIRSVDGVTRTLFELHQGPLAAQWIARVAPAYSLATPPGAALAEGVRDRDRAYLHLFGVGRFYAALCAVRDADAKLGGGGGLPKEEEDAATEKAVSLAIEALAAFRLLAADWHREAASSSSPSASNKPVVSAVNVNAVGNLLVYASGLDEIVRSAGLHLNCLIPVFKGVWSQLPSLVGILPYNVFNDAADKIRAAFFAACMPPLPEGEGDGEEGQGAASLGLASHGPVATRFRKEIFALCSPPAYSLAYQVACSIASPSRRDESIARLMRTLSEAAAAGHPEASAALSALPFTEQDFRKAGVVRPQDALVAAGGKLGHLKAGTSAWDLVATDSEVRHARSTYDGKHLEAASAALLGAFQLRTAIVAASALVSVPQQLLDAARSCAHLFALASQSMAAARGAGIPPHRILVRTVVEVDGGQDDAGAPLPTVQVETRESDAADVQLEFLLAQARADMLSDFARAGNAAAMGGSGMRGGALLAPNLVATRALLTPFAREALGDRAALLSRPAPWTSPAALQAWMVATGRVAAAVRLAVAAEATRGSDEEGEDDVVTDAGEYGEEVPALSAEAAQHLNADGALVPKVLCVTHIVRLVSSAVAKAPTLASANNARDVAVACGEYWAGDYPLAGVGISVRAALCEAVITACQAAPSPHIAAHAALSVLEPVADEEESDTRTLQARITAAEGKEDGSTSGSGSNVKCESLDDAVSRLRRLYEGTGRR